MMLFIMIDAFVASECFMIFAGFLATAIKQYLRAIGSGLGTS